MRASLKDVVPGALGHIMIASMMSLPVRDPGRAHHDPGEGGVATTSASDLKYRSSMDAVARGTEDGLKIYLQILAMLIVMVALVALADTILKSLPQVWGAPLSLERVFGWLFAPVVWLFGVRGGPGGDGGQPDGHQDDPQRARRLSQPCGAAPRARSTRARR